MLSKLEMLCLIYGQLRAIRAAKVVTIDGPNDPKALEGSLVYELELNNGQHSRLTELVNQGLNADAKGGDGLTDKERKDFDTAAAICEELKGKVNVNLREEIETAIINALCEARAEETA
jgi:hypothetical protein